jgi:hypothetical protein
MSHKIDTILKQNFVDKVSFHSGPLYGFTPKDDIVKQLLRY